MKYRIVKGFWEEGGIEKSGEFLVPPGFKDDDCVEGYIRAASTTRPPGHCGLKFLKSKYVKDHDSQPSL